MFKQNINNLTFLSLSLSFFSVFAQDDYYKLGCEAGTIAVNSIIDEISQKSEKRVTKLLEKVKTCASNKDMKNVALFFRGLLSKVKDVIPNPKNNYLGYKLNKAGICVTEILNIFVNFIDKLINSKNLDKYLALRTNKTKIFETIEKKLDTKFSAIVAKRKLTQLNNLLTGKPITDHKALINNLKDFLAEYKKEESLNDLKKDLKDAKLTNEESEYYLECRLLIIDLLTDITNLKNLEKINQKTIENLDFFA